MIATGFDEENGVLDAPLGVSPEECEPLSVWVGPTQDGSSVIISCWKPTKDELEEIQKTGRVWLIVHGGGMPPVSLSGVSPFKE